MIAPAAVTALLQRFDPADDGEAAKSKELVLALLASSPEPFSRRQFNPGHITCTGLVLSPGRDRILLVLHRRLQRWLLPGGHVEPDDPVIGDAARREVVEETGAVLRAGSPPLLVGVDVHGIPVRRDEPFHLHHDLIFLFQAESDAFQTSEEVREVAWCPVAEFDHYQLPGSIRRSYARALASAQTVDFCG
ncbi:MAG: NUDIX domain-containing protein [Bryobacteraceae bacterium]|jgi:8-oxo-dGTP pyrophosphatase MutT (NUDIX family)